MIDIFEVLDKLVAAIEGEAHDVLLRKMNDKRYIRLSVYARSEWHSVEFVPGVANIDYEIETLKRVVGEANASR